MSQKNRLCTLDLSSRGTPVCPTRQRLAQAFVRLRNIQLTREESQDPIFAKHEEERIVWRELLELELQDIDERIEGISATAGHAAA